MIKLGNFNILTIARSAPMGLFLEDDQQTEILLPNSEIPPQVRKGDTLNVFCYLDSEERPIATLKQPLIQRNHFACLMVEDTNSMGAFMGWGLPKQLLVPFKEQPKPFAVGEKQVVYCKLDEVTYRLIASGRIEKHLVKVENELQSNEEVSLLPYRKTALGWSVIVNQKYQGLIFQNQIHQNISLGNDLKGYVKSIRPDGKLDITLTPQGIIALDFVANSILETLKNNGGWLSLSDQSSPEEIKNRLGISKKAFKKGVGVLYKKRLILIQDNGLKIIAQETKDSR